MDDFDPTAKETFDSPHAEFKRLRRECPVAHTSKMGGFWALTKHKDVLEAASDYKTFVTSVQNVVPKVAFTGRRPPLHLDPPEHTVYRRALSPLLSVQKLAWLQPIIEDICDEILADMVAKGGGDICNEFSASMPIKTFAHWMNLQSGQVDALADVGRRYNIAVQSNDMEKTKEASAILYEMAENLVEERRASPMATDQDATSALLATRVDGEPLPTAMIIGTIRQVLVVGIIAPTVLFGSICVHLCRDQDLQQKLRENPALIPAAIEEFLRLYMPYRGFARTPNRDICLGGRNIAKDEAVALVYASANRDEDVFEKPEKFILDRGNIHEAIPFGAGPHKCPGEALARMEMITGLRKLLACTKKFTLDGDIIPTKMPEIGALSVPLMFE